MKATKYLIILLLTAFTFSCKKKGCTNPYAKNYDAKANEEDCSCVAYVDEMEGTYKIVVTKYPRDPNQEGEEKEVLVYRDHLNCNSFSDEDFNKIKFNNLFTFMGCDPFILVDKYQFEVTLDNNVKWAGAPVTGVGRIENGVLHFEGTVYTSSGEFPIVLDGTKTSTDRRTEAC